MNQNFKNSLNLQALDNKQGGYSKRHAMGLTDYL